MENGGRGFHHDDTTTRRHNDTTDFNTEEAKETKDEDVDGFLPPPRRTDYGRQRIHKETEDGNDGENFTTMAR